MATSRLAAWAGVAAASWAAVDAAFVAVMWRYGLRRQRAYEERMRRLGLTVNPCYWCRTGSEPSDPTLHHLEHLYQEKR